MTTTFTSFSNPNYRLEDRINSNDILSPDYEGTNFYDSINLQSPTENVRDTNGSARTRRKKYGEIDLVSMGLCDDVTPVDSPYNSSSEPSTLQSPSSDERDSLSGQDDVVNGESEGGINCFTDTELVICDDDVYEDVGPDVIPKSRHKNTNTSNTVTESKTLTESSKSSRGFLGYYSMLEAKAREFSVRNTMESPASDDHTDYEEEETTPSSSTSKQERFDDALYISSPDSNDSGIQSDARSDDGGPTHLRGPLTDDIYTVVNRPRKEKNPLDDEQQELERSKRHSTIPAVQSLPSGWEKCDDEEGAYYWHIKSGTIQREPPSPSHVITAKRSISLTSGINTAASSLLSPVSSAAPTEPQSLTAEEHLQEFQGHALQYAAKSLQSLQSAGTKEAAPPKFSDNEHDFEQPIRFAVRSLGWVRVAEEDLTPERSSKAVNKCIVDLSLGRNDINDVVGRWGDGKDLFMDLDRYSLSLIDPHDEAVLNTQTIHSVRVWGVGRDNGRLKNRKCPFEDQEKTLFDRASHSSDKSPKIVFS